MCFAVAFIRKKQNYLAFCVFTRSEAVEFDTLTISRSISRNLEVAVEAYVKDTANYDNTLDELRSKLKKLYPQM